MIHGNRASIKSLKNDFEIVIEKYFNEGVLKLGRTYLVIYFLEKLVLYTSSGRWKGSEAAAVEDLMSAIGHADTALFLRGDTVDLS